MELCSLIDFDALFASLSRWVRGVYRWTAHVPMWSQPGGRPPSWVRVLEGGVLMVIQQRLEIQEDRFKCCV